jgi:hypothetical protein
VSELKLHRRRLRRRVTGLTHSPAKLLIRIWTVLTATKINPGQSKHPGSLQVDTSACRLLRSGRRGVSGDGDAVRIGPTKAFITQLALGTCDGNHPPARSSVRLHRTIRFSLPVATLATPAFAAELSAGYWGGGTQPWRRFPVLAQGYCQHRAGYQPLSRPRSTSPACKNCMLPRTMFTDFNAIIQHRDRLRKRHARQSAMALLLQYVVPTLNLRHVQRLVH